MNCFISQGPVHRVVESHQHGGAVLLEAVVHQHRRISVHFGFQGKQVQRIVCNIFLILGELHQRKHKTEEISVIVCLVLLLI